MVIDRFDGKYAFLSNFYEAPVTYQGIRYSSNEAAFQAQKTLDEKAKAQFVNLPPGQAKRLGRRVKLRSDWEVIKVQVMYEIVLAKFEQNPDIRQLLLKTGDARLVEGNYWHDTFWGVCEGVGENNLGKILMRVRAELLTPHQG